jgi:hypothetical protein
MARAYIADNQPVMIHLEFDPLAAGKIVNASASTGVIIDPPPTKLQVRPTGDCVVTVRLQDGYAKGHVSFSCEGRQTTLPLSRASSAIVAANETPKQERSR